MINWGHIIARLHLVYTLLVHCWQSEFNIFIHMNNKMFLSHILDFIKAMKHNVTYVVSIFRRQMSICAHLTQKLLSNNGRKEEFMNMTPLLPPNTPM